MSEKAFKELQKKIQQLEKQIERNAVHEYAFLTAMLEILADRDLIKPKEFQAYLDRHTNHYKRLSKDAEFFKIAKQIKPDPNKKHKS